MIHSHPNRTIPDLRRNCLPSCLKYSLSWLHPLRSWSLRQTRRGSKTQACVYLSAIEHNRLILNGWSKRNSRPRPSRSPIALIRPETKPSMRMSHYTKNLECRPTVRRTVGSVYWGDLAISRAASAASIPACFKRSTATAPVSLSSLFSVSEASPKL